MPTGLIMAGKVVFKHSNNVRDGQLPPIRSEPERTSCAVRGRSRAGWIELNFYDGRYTYAQHLLILCCFAFGVLYSPPLHIPIPARSLAHLFPPPVDIYRATVNQRCVRPIAISTCLIAVRRVVRRSAGRKDRHFLTRTVPPAWRVQYY